MRRLVCDAPFQIQESEMTEEGFLRLTGVAAKVGVLEYPEDDDRKDLVTEEALTGESVESLKNATLVYEHPPERKVEPENYQLESVGVVLDAWFEDDKQYVQVEIRDADAIEAVQEREATGLSPGYEPKVEDDTGEHDDHGAYTRRQVGRRNNHLAITNSPRGEEDTKLHVDSFFKLDEDDAMEDEEEEEVQKDETDLDAKLDAINEKLRKLMPMLKEEEEEDEEDEADMEEDEEEMEGDAFRQQFKVRKQAVDVADQLDVDYSDDDSTLAIMHDVVAEHSGGRLETDSDEAIEAAFYLAKNQIGEEKSKDAEKFEENFFENDSDDDDDIFEDVGVFT